MMQHSNERPVRWFVIAFMSDVLHSNDYMALPKTNTITCSPNKMGCVLYVKNLSARVATEILP